MRLEHIYLRQSKREKSTKKDGLLRTFLFGGMLMVLPLVGSAQFAPIPYETSPQNRTICGNLVADINDWLRVSDLDLGETITWSIFTPPNNGFLGGFPTTASTPGSTIIPTGLTYTADPGATADAFAIEVSDGVNPSVILIVNLSINNGPSLTLGTMPSVCAGVTVATIPFSGLTNVGPDTAMFSYTGGSQSWTVPANVTSFKYDIMGAAGGRDSYIGGVAGKGGRVQGTISVAPFTNVGIEVGGKGSDGTGVGAAGGYNGGGDAYFYFYGSGGAGGGATDLRIGGMGLANRKVVAGGGGGNGADGTTTFAGGNGGGPVGANSAANVFGSSARGGSQTAGGAGANYFGWLPGAFGSAGNGGDGSTNGLSGGGGGGFYGGGGGIWNGGAGGSSYSDPITTFSVIHTQGVNEGDGMVNIYYTNPGTYTIIWDSVTTGGAFDAGFVNVADAALPTNGQFTFAVPAGVAPGTYHGALFINNVSCNSVEYPIEITVKPLPTVTTPSDIVVCHGNPVPFTPFSGPLGGSAYNWVNDNPAIGLAAAGEGHIPAFSPSNDTHFPVSANITITPVANGCIGAPVVFQIVDNPIPVLNSSATPPAICNNTAFSYIPGSLTPGTSFAWSRDTILGIAEPGNTGTNNPGEVLSNTTIDPISVPYVYTLTASGCSNTATVPVVVNPTPSLSSEVNPAPLCNNATFNYTPASLTTGATLTWNRPVVAGISNPSASGTGAISETLINTTATPKTVIYAITMSIGGCNYAQNVTVVVNPSLRLTSTTALTPTCDSLLLHYEPTTVVSGATITWSRSLIAGISNAAATGVGNIDETLVNTTAAPIVVTYDYTVAAFGCTLTQPVTITVNPRPRLSSSLTPDAICTNSLFSYTASSATAGTTFTWARDFKAGISNAPVLSSGNVSEILVNFTDTTIIVPYLYTSFTNGCANQESVLVTVHPLPKISNNISALAVCDSAVFSFNPASITPGATFTWTRGYEAGIANLAASGSGNPTERLNNTTYISVPVTYQYTIIANGCSNSQNVTVQVRPSAILTSNTAVVCSGAPFTYNPVSYTSGTQFAWSRSATPGITPDTADGTGSISDVLTHTQSTPVIVEYDYALTIFGCVNMQNVLVTVNPAPAAGVIATHTSTSLCNNAMYMNFGAATPAAAGTTYSWSATNASIHSTSSDGQYALVNFTTPGNATVTLTTRTTATTCTNSSATYNVNVGSGTTPSPEVIYFDGQFICKQNDVKSYQWGFDDASTFDSTILVGETNQNYANAFPDFAKRNYWVITTHNNGCVVKTFFNKPTGVADVNTATAEMKVYPNPASSHINVEVSRTVKGAIYMEVYNMLGQQLQHVDATDNKAQIGIADLPAGAYIVDCYSDGIKVAAARFIKN